MILVAVDGGRPGSSVGMTTYELAQTMAKLGAVTAAGLQYGKFVTAAFDGQVLNRPSQPSGQVAVKEALLIQYAGVYALPPSVPVLGKANVTGGEQLAYRITHPSQVTATLVGPDGQSHQLDSGSKQPGTYRFSWTSFDTEGTWHWNVQATDDQNRASTADQAFAYDLTLSGLAVPKSASAANGAARSGSRSRVQRRSCSRSRLRTGRPSRRCRRPSSTQAPQSLTWDGTIPGAKAPPGAYVATVTETSSLGTTSVHASFTLHR